MSPRFHYQEFFELISCTSLNIKCKQTYQTMPNNETLRSVNVNSEYNCHKIGFEN